MEAIRPVEGSEGEQRRVAVRDLVEMLAQPLGLDKASDEVQAALRDTELTARDLLSVQEARLVLDTISKGPGIVAIAANLAKVKLILAGNAGGS